MNYYKIKDLSIDLEQKSKGLVADIPGANGEFVPNHEEYFSKMMEGEIIENCPVFDYFHLQSFGDKKDWEWRLQDVHRGIGSYPSNNNWYISDDFKLLLENFKIAPKYHFYETRLLYKGEKLKYWIFQFIASYRRLNKMEYIDFSNSVFYANEQSYYCDSFDKWSDTNEDVYDKHNVELILKKICINQFFDFMPLNPISSDIICSETLKNAIEIMDLKGFEFTELNYDVVINL